MLQRKTVRASALKLTTRFNVALLPFLLTDVINNYQSKNKKIFKNFLKTRLDQLKNMMRLTILIGCATQR